MEKYQSSLLSTPLAALSYGFTSARAHLVREFAPLLDTCRRSCTIAIGLVLVAPQLAYSQVANGDFEIPSLGEGGQQGTPAGASWTFSGQSGFAANGCNWNPPPAPSGIQVVYLQSANGYVASGITQTANFSGGTYALTFQAARRGQLNTAPLPITVKIDDNVVLKCAPLRDIFENYRTDPFTLTSGNHTIKFEIPAGTPVAPNNTVFIDAVSAVKTTFNNGSFETPALGAGGQKANPTGATWMFDGLSGVAANGSAWAPPNAPNGIQCAYMQSATGYTNGSVSQMIYLVPGNYSISFNAALRSNYQGAISLNVLVDEQVVGTFSPTDMTQFVSYNTNTNPIRISIAGHHTIKFAVTGAATNSTIFVDWVGVYNVTPNTSGSGLVNGGFETPNFGPGGQRGSPSGSSWTWGAGPSGICANGSNWTPPTAPEGIQVAYLQSAAGYPTASVSQVVNFLPGTYRVKFKSALRNGNTPISFNVLLDTTILGTYTPSSNVFSSYTSNSFLISTAGNKTLKFQINGTATNSTVFLDAITLDSVGTGTYKVVACNSGQALAASGGATASNTPLVTAIYDGGVDKQWVVTNLGNGQYTMRGVGSGRYVQVANSSMTAASPIRLYNYANQDNFKFTLTANDDGSYTPVFVHSGMAMSVQGNSKSTYSVVEQNPYSGILGQRWKFLPPAEGAGAGENFSMVVLPDTQHETQGWMSQPYMFYDQTSWVVNNVKTRNIKYVGGVGDIVEHGANTSQWQVAANALYMLDDVVPYGTVPGNHDYDYDGVTIFHGSSVSQYYTLQYYNQYFGPWKWADKSYYGGNFSFNGDNGNASHYDLISAGGMDFIMIHIAYHQTRDLPIAYLDADIEWADSVLKAHPNRRAILFTHELIYGDHSGDPEMSPWRSNGGQRIYDGLKDNLNLFLMLCGHVCREGRRYDVYNGNTIYSVNQDYQDPDPDLGGNGILRYIEFQPKENLISFQSYCTQNGEWFPQFTVPYKMH